MKKAVILALYAVSLYLVVSRWYKAGNSGIPTPQIVGPPSYLFGVLALTAEFLGGLPVVLAAGLTFILWQRKTAYPTSGGTAKTTGGSTPQPTTGATSTQDTTTNSNQQAASGSQAATGKHVFQTGYKPPTKMNLGGSG